MQAKMNEFYIAGLCTKQDHEKCPVYGLDRFNRRKDGGDDENCNGNRKKGGSKKVF
jgi:hypothetical protein